MGKNQNVSESVVSAKRSLEQMGTLLKACACYQDLFELSKPAEGSNVDNEALLSELYDLLELLGRLQGEALEAVKYVDGVINV